MGSDWSVFVSIASKDTSSTSIPVYLQGISRRSTEQTLWNYFSKLGKVQAVSIMFRDGVVKGWGEVWIMSFETVKNIVDSKHRVDDSEITCCLCPQTKQFNGLSEDEQGRTMFYKGLPLNACEQDVFKRFIRFGEIERLTVCRSADGISKGTGFILFKYIENLEYILRHKETFSHRILNTKIHIFKCHIRDSHNKAKGYNEVCLDNLSENSLQSKWNIDNKTKRFPQQPYTASTRTDNYSALTRQLANTHEDNYTRADRKNNCQAAGIKKNMDTGFVAYSQPGSKLSHHQQLTQKIHLTSSSLLDNSQSPQPRRLAKQTMDSLPTDNNIWSESVHRRGEDNYRFNRGKNINRREHPIDNSMHRDTEYCHYPVQHTINF